tara:strand:- start:2143 stop:3141 length:999 start_codon:yes stop_codon:yes gene_type:complete
MNIIKKIDWYADYIVHWRPLDMCNYDCSYCSPSNHRSIIKKNIVIVDDLIAAASNIRNNIPADKTVLVYVTGGEPFLIPKVHQWFNFMSDNDFKVGVFTNGSLPISQYMKCKNSFKNINMEISFHPESADIAHVVELASTIVEHGGSVEIRAMLVNKLFDRVDALEIALKEYSIPVVRLPVFPLYDASTNTVNPTFASSRNLEHYLQTIDDGSLGYFSTTELKQVKDNNHSTPEYLNVTVDGIESNASTIVRNNQNRFKGWKCSVTNKKIVIQANGNVQYGICNNTGSIGNIFNPNLKLFKDEFTVCNQQECHTIDEVMITKYKDNDTNVYK